MCPTHEGHELRLLKNVWFEKHSDYKLMKMQHQIWQRIISAKFPIKINWWDLYVGTYHMLKPICVLMKKLS